MFVFPAFRGSISSPFKRDLYQIWIVEVEVAKSITRELRGTPKMVKPVNPVKAEAAKRESRVEMLTERMTHGPVE